MYPNSFSTSCINPKVNFRINLWVTLPMENAPLALQLVPRWCMPRSIMPRFTSKTRCSFRGISQRWKPQPSTRHVSLQSILSISHSTMINTKKKGRRMADWRRLGYLQMVLRTNKKMYQKRHHCVGNHGIVGRVLTSSQRISTQLGSDG